MAMHDPHPQYPGFPSRIDRSKIIAFLDDIGIEHRNAGIVSVELGVFDVTVKRLGHGTDGHLTSREAAPDIIHIGINSAETSLYGSPGWGDAP
jgi:hypothetical protein